MKIIQVLSETGLNLKKSLKYLIFFAVEEILVGVFNFWNAAFYAESFANHK